MLESCGYRQADAASGSRSLSCSPSSNPARSRSTAVIALWVRDHCIAIAAIAAPGTEPALRDPRQRGCADVSSRLGLVPSGFSGTGGPILTGNGPCYLHRLRRRCIGRESNHLDSESEPTRSAVTFRRARRTAHASRRVGRAKGSGSHGLLLGHQGAEDQSWVQSFRPRRVRHWRKVWR